MKTGYKEYSDAYLMTFTKTRLIEQLRCAEDNFRRTEWMLNQQAENIKDWRPVVHAHWEREEDYEGTHHICSNCHSRCPSIMTVPATVDHPYGEVEEIELSEIVYCPSCGAKMDEEVEQ